MHLKVCVKACWKLGKSIIHPSKFDSGMIILSKCFVRCEGNLPYL